MGALRRSELVGLDAEHFHPTPLGTRAGFITTAYRNGVSDEEIMGTRATAAYRRCAAAYGVESSATKVRQASLASGKDRRETDDLSTRPLAPKGLP